eukprot:1175002-Prymnesium_polylepis.1
MHPPEPPDHAADPPRPTPTYPTPQGGARSASALLAAQPERCSSSSRLPARSLASSVKWCGSAPPSRRSSE